MERTYICVVMSTLPNTLVVAYLRSNTKLSETLGESISGLRVKSVVARWAAEH
jgi:hypothetical protein